MTPTRLGRPATDLDADLAPVRAALLAEARAEADRVVAAARRDAAATITAARAQAARIRAEAAGNGAADAAQAAAATRVRARRQARAIELRARRQAYDALHERATGAVTALTGDPGYPAIRAGLVAAARDRLGPDAAIREPPGGGIVAQAPGLRLDLSLVGFVDAAVLAVVAEREEAPPAPAEREEAPADREAAR